MSSADSKSTFRAAAKSQFPTDPEEKNRKNTAIIKALLADPRLKMAKQIGLYVARPSEVDLKAIFENFPKKCAFPKVIGKHQMSFFRIDEWADLKPGFKGIGEPSDDAHLEVRWRPGDILFIPGLCFDPWGGRIGSGMGFYDRYLEDIHPHVLKWGICWKEQLSQVRLPQAKNDVRMDALWTDASSVALESI